MVSYVPTKRSSDHDPISWLCRMIRHFGHKKQFFGWSLSNLKFRSDNVASSLKYSVIASSTQNPPNLLTMSLHRLFVCPRPMTLWKQTRTCSCSMFACSHVRKVFDIIILSIHLEFAISDRYFSISAYRLSTTFYCILYNPRWLIHTSFCSVRPPLSSLHAYSNGDLIIVKPLFT